MKAADFIKRANGECALVATNSICQGDHVPLLWPLLFAQKIEIGFAHQSFKWKNNATNNAGVICVVVGIRCASSGPKFLYNIGLSRKVKNIGPYLIESDNIVVLKRSTAIADLPTMLKGNQPSDGGNLILSRLERDQLLRTSPESERSVKRYFGSQEILKGVERWCLWIEDADLGIALSVPEIGRRVELVRRMRLSSDTATTVAMAQTPHRFIQIQDFGKDAVIVPRNTSERRQHIPVAIAGTDAIISDQAFAVYDAKMFVFSLLSSRLHYIWFITVAGRLKDDPRYSNTLVYNTFPCPPISGAQSVALEEHALSILEEREKHPGKSISWLYDPDTMPTNPLDAHHALDEALEKIYIGRSFKGDTERLEHLFKRYAEMTAEKEKEVANA